MGRDADPNTEGPNHHGASARELSALVARTEGLQPWRRVFHLVSGTLLATLVSRLGPGSREVTVLLGVPLLIAAALDLVRLRYDRVNAWFFRGLSALASPREARGVASSTWYLVGLLVVHLLFPSHVLVPAILVLALADPVAGVVGRLWGRRRIGTGTVRGSAAFLLVSVAVLAAHVSPGAAVTAAIWVTFWEAAPLPADDNLTVPLATAVALAVLS